MFHEEGNATELIAAEVVRRIEEKQSPWFIYVPFHAVHTPVDAPPEYKTLYDGIQFHADPVKHESRLRIAAMVAQLDTKIGQFVDALEQTGQRDKTLILFTSDNGGIEGLKNAYIGEVGDSPLNSENDPLRGQKNTLYEGGIRVCAFANWPNVVTPRKISVPMHAVDWFPTIAEIVSYQPSEDLNWDGISQWTTLQTGLPASQTRTIYIAKNDGHALRDGDWKLIVPRKGKLQLFHLSDDPFEELNLADQEPDRVKELTRLLDIHRAKDNPVLPKDLEGLPN